MRCIVLIVVAVAFCMVPILALAQSHFSVQLYRQFLQDNRDLTSEEFLSQHVAPTAYYTGIEHGVSLRVFSYLDSVLMKYHLTTSEVDLLKRNHFVVTERLSFDCFGKALYDIYRKDLPVFVTTDAILHALHASYDRLLMDIEWAILEPKLGELLNGLYSVFPQLVRKYDSNTALRDALRDVDVYVTMAISLLEGAKRSPQYASSEGLDVLWDAVNSEQLVMMPLFSERPRKLDFSQFRVRGHYTESLAQYFRCMMWLGRIDFMLAHPPALEQWEREEIRRMNLGAVLLNELVDMAGVRSVLNQIDEVIQFIVGESDNLTPAELAGVIEAQHIRGADDLLDDLTYDAFQEVLTASSAYGQRILSSFLVMNPFSHEPDVLPVSFRLMGQRFIIDSYILSNVVYDRIIYQGRKIWRPMPDPLDAMFVLGNDNALPLLREELETYHYSSQLAALRYLVDAYDAEFWDGSLYNLWLQAIRLLNPSADRTGWPFFMHTAAWQQEKLNTQLASWTQLRHDNLLYAKQSWTAAGLCSFPHAFVEPYPAFYRQIEAFADKAEAYFAGFRPSGNWILDGILNRIQSYFPRLKDVMSRLETIAQKELDKQVLSSEEIEFLQKMLFVSNVCGAPPFSGWYSDLFYDPWDDVAKSDYLVADVHTQPTDEFGNIVGRVLHVGVGKANLGVFLSDSPSNDYQPMAFVGPVMSYYEKITDGFDRLTDERWTAVVESGDVPARPDWVNIYLADREGNALGQGREVPGVLYTAVVEDRDLFPKRFRLSQNYPNPFNSATVITYQLPVATQVELVIYDVAGQKVKTLVRRQGDAGFYSVLWNGVDDAGRSVASGIYLYRLEAGSFTETRKTLLLR